VKSPVAVVFALFWASGMALVVQVFLHRSLWGILANLVWLCVVAVGVYVTKDVLDGDPFWNRKAGETLPVINAKDDWESAG
jgi:hypothetical protein